MAQSVLLAVPSTSFIGSPASALSLRPAPLGRTSNAKRLAAPRIQAQFREEDEKKRAPEKISERISEKVSEAMDRATGAVGKAAGAAGGERGAVDMRGATKEKSPAEMLSESAERLTGMPRGAIQERQKQGIFGTSGTLGFTKRNELFVGRVAMLGFAAAAIGEMFTGKGPLGQLNMETGIPLNQAPPLLLVFILFMIFGAFTSVGLGAQGYQEADPQQAMKSARQFNWRGMIGLPARGPFFGFTQPNEYLNGRLAQLGFAACLLGELATGKGPIGQLSLETGIPGIIIAPLMIVVPLMFVALFNADYDREAY